MLDRVDAGNIRDPDCREDGVAVTLTPDAALETSERLLDAGLTAQGQRVQKSREGTAVSCAW